MFSFPIWTSEFNSTWEPAVKTEITPKTGNWDFGETEVSYVFYVMYDENYLYVAVRLTDDDIQIDTAAKGSIGGQTWKDDSIEIFKECTQLDFLSALGLERVR